MRVAFCFPIALIALTLVIGAAAQPVMTNSAAVLQAPVSNLLVLATATGKVRVLDSRGLLLESNMVYLPRIRISDLSDSELHSLLETKRGYAALTSFGPQNERNGQSADIENQLRQIWLQGKTLGEKIQTRLALLDEMRAYNQDLAYLPGLATGAGDAAARATWVDERAAGKNQAATDAANGLENIETARAYGDASREEVHDARSEYEEANERAVRANNRAIAADNQSAVANQSLQNYLNACAGISGDLAAHGIKVPGAPPFYRIPPLSMRSEVDAERLAGTPSSGSSPTGR